MRWLHVFSLVLMVSAGVAHAQMDGNLANDIAILEAALSPALAAAKSGQQDASSLAMEELYRQWRNFRRMNIEAYPDDPLLAPDLDMIEARLFEASQRIDAGNLSGASVELEGARAALLVVRERHGIPPTG